MYPFKTPLSERIFHFPERVTNETKSQPNHTSKREKKKSDSKFFIYIPIPAVLPYRFQFVSSPFPVFPLFHPTTKPPPLLPLPLAINLPPPPNPLLHATHQRLQPPKID